MKKAVPILLIISMAFIFLSVKASAAEATGSYLIREEGEYYILSEQGTSNTEIGRFASLADCFLQMTDISSIFFDNILSDSSLELPRGEYTLKGNLTSSGVISVPKGASVTLSGFTMVMNGGAYLRIKGGEMTVDSSSITGDGELIRLDYSSSSSLTVNSGVISGEYEGALINLKNGSACILGADIENKGGAAIKNDSELILSGTPSIKGAPYGIISESPIHLSYDGVEYYSESGLSLQYPLEFLEGTLTEVLYSASARSVANIKLYDKDGKEAPLTQFDSTNHTSEKNFAGVYLPYTVSFYIDDIKVHEEKFLSGESPSAYSPEPRDGYIFDSWYTDREGVTPYSFDSVVNSSFSLFGIYDLVPPSFAISSLDFIYDGEEHTLGFDSLSHPLEGGYYTYIWYRNGQEISSLSSIKVRNVSDSGCYSCQVTYSYNGKTAKVYAENIKVSINYKEIPIPQIPSMEYTGNPIYPTVPTSSYYTVSSVSGIDVGIYPQTLTLTDPENTKWQGMDAPSITLNFEITRAENRWLELPKVYDSYIGFPLRSQATSKFGQVIYLYSATENGIYKIEAPSSVGTYFVKAKVVESKNYTELVSSPMQFSILAEEVVGISLEASPQKTEYFSFDKLELEGIIVKAIYNSSREEILENHRFNIIYNNGDTLRMGDTGVTLEYLGATLIIPITVKPLSYDLSGLNFRDFSLVYDGEYHSYEETLIPIIGKDGIPLRYKISGGGKDAGEYNVTLSFATESPDYLTPESITVKMTVLPRQVELLWDIPSFVYDGGSHAPTASFIDAHGIKRTVSVYGAKVFAGEDYTAEASPYSDNYVYKNPTVTYSIAKADYDMSGIFWSASTLTYTGEYLEVILQGLPDGISVVGYTDNRAINAGEYFATASLKYDSKNYNAPAVPTLRWSITPAEYDIGGFEFVSAEYEYDGTVKYPILNGSLPTGADGIPLEYGFSCGAKDVTDGEVLVTILFATESKNYIAPAPITATVRIIPKGIYVLWTSDSFTYNGKLQIPDAESAYAKINVTGGSINAGIYTATAESDDPNYKIENSTHTYEIKKAENYWLSAPSIEAFYESKIPSPTATAYNGATIFRYYSDESLTEEVSTFTHGIYYMVATVLESQNYLPLISAPIEVEVIEVLPIDIRVEITSDLVAMETLEKEDFILYLLYNDGSEALIQDGVTVSYENADTLLHKDRTVQFIYSGFTKDIPISVKKATYDTSGVTWNTNEAVYDGSPKSPEISGLPSGVTLLGYSNSAKINAGTYAFVALISYDEENYNPPELPECVFTIKKATVTKIPDITVEYSGSQVPLEETELYILSDEYSIMNSGEYQITYKLTHPENYEFENGSDIQAVNVTVTPRAINITVSDFDLYLFENEITPDYQIEGAIVSGDDLALYYYLDGDNIYLASSNPNYTLNVNCGKLNRINYPNESIRRQIMLVILLIVIIATAVFILLRNKDSILDFICMSRTKQKNKAYIGYIDNSINEAPMNVIDVHPKDDTPIPEDKAESEENNSYEDTELKDEEFFEEVETQNETTFEEPSVTEYSDREELKSDAIEDEIQEKTDIADEIPDEPKIRIKMEDADAMLSDSMAKGMIKDEREKVYTEGKSKSIINVDTLSRNFIADDKVDVNILKQKSLVPYDTAYVKVLARGAIDKPLHVYANDFSLSAVKMILLSGGEARRVTTVRTEKNKTKR